MTAPAPGDNNYDSTVEGVPVNIVNDEGLGADIFTLINAINTLTVAVNALTAKISPKLLDLEVGE
jgi:hypothetical protein